MQSTDKMTAGQIWRATGWPEEACRMAGRARDLIYDHGNDDLTSDDRDALAEIVRSWARGARGARS
jgi:hypothetical protein